MRREILEEKKRGIIHRKWKFTSFTKPQPCYFHFYFCPCDKGWWRFIKRSRRTKLVLVWKFCLAVMWTLPSLSSKELCLNILWFYEDCHRRFAAPVMALTHGLKFKLCQIPQERCSTVVGEWVYDLRKVLKRKCSDLSTFGLPGCLDVLSSFVAKFPSFLPLDVKDPEQTVKLKI